MAGGSGDKSFEVKVGDNSNFLSESESDYVPQGLDRFPLLVWKKILENFSSWDYLDMQRFFAVVKLPTNFLTDPTLHSVRRNVAFHFILPTLITNYVGSGNGSGDESLLDFQDIYNCRLVCRAWNTAIRKNVVEHVSRSQPNCCLHEWENNFLWPRESRNHYANHCNRAYSHFAFTSGIQNFLSYFEQSHRCKGDVSPFHCHHVGFQLSSDSCPEWMMNETEITVSSAAVFFVQCGKHLRRLNLNLCCHDVNYMSRLYPGVFDLLRESLNLEALRISWKCNFVDKNGGIEGFWKSNENAGSCPELKFLTHLEVDGLPHPLFNDIIRSNGEHIEKLKISGLEDRSCALFLFRKYKLHEIPLENLRELRIRFECATKKDIARLKNSAPHWTKLEKLYLDFEGGSRVQKEISWFYILQCLNKFAETVTHLWLRFPTLTSKLNVGPLHDYRPTREETLELQNLKQVVIKFPQSSTYSFDFLFGLKNLQTLYLLELGVPLDDQLCKNKIELFYMYRNSLEPEKIMLSSDLQYSKIWEQFPKLSKFYWRQLNKKWAWKRSLEGKSRGELTSWTLQDMVEEMPEFWTNFWAHLNCLYKLLQIDE